VTENELGESVLGCAIRVHRVLGPGLLESAYEACLAHELGKAGLSYSRQLALPVVYDGLRIDAGYRIDLLVGDMVAYSAPLCGLRG
jgi:GxxExxY protein